MSASSQQQIVASNPMQQTAHIPGTWSSIVASRAPLVTPLSHARWVIPQPDLLLLVALRTEGLADLPNVIRHTGTSGSGDSLIEITGVLDPLSKAAQRLTPVLIALRDRYCCCVRRAWLSPAGTSAAASCWLLPSPCCLSRVFCVQLRREHRDHAEPGARNQRTAAQGTIALNSSPGIAPVDSLRQLLCVVQRFYRYAIQPQLHFDDSGAMRVSSVQ